MPLGIGGALDKDGAMGRAVDRDGAILTAVDKDGAIVIAVGKDDEVATAGIKEGAIGRAVDIEGAIGRAGGIEGAIADSSFERFADFPFFPFLTGSEVATAGTKEGEIGRAVDIEGASGRSGDIDGAIADSSFERFADFPLFPFLTGSFTPPRFDMSDKFNDNRIFLSTLKLCLVKTLGE
jgi:hypothetical protein